MRWRSVAPQLVSVRLHPSRSPQPARGLSLEQEVLRTFLEVAMVPTKTRGNQRPAPLPKLLALRKKTVSPECHEHSEHSAPEGEGPSAVLLFRDRHNKSASAPLAPPSAHPRWTRSLRTAGTVGTSIRVGDTGRPECGHYLDAVPCGQLAEEGFRGSGLGGRRGLRAEAPSQVAPAD